MITLNDERRNFIASKALRMAKERYSAPQLGAIHDTIDATISELNLDRYELVGDDRLAPPEPVNHPRTATITKLDDGSYLLVIQNGDCIASVTMTTPQMIAWEFREASK